MFHGNNNALACLVLLALSVINASAIQIEDAEVNYGYDTPSYIPDYLVEGQSIRVTVTVKGRNEEAYVGMTIISPSGREFDFTPKSVRCEEGWQGIGPENSRVTFHANITNAMDAGIRNLSGMELVISLWERIVYSSECARARGGSSCKWCKLNGYHMEGRLDSHRMRIPGLYYSD